MVKSVTSSHIAIKSNIDERYIGLMSGTSMDGVDAVCVLFNNGVFQKSLGHYFIPYQPSLREALLSLQQVSHNELHQSEELSREISLVYTTAVQALLKQLALGSEAITAIGCHGQTIRHCPQKHYSIQLANYAILAEKTGIPVVGDFRSADLAAGGEGAPLVPLFHHNLFANSNIPRALINIGGIANISVLTHHSPQLGFDIGPGNMLLDAYCRMTWQKACDQDGYYSSQGKILPLFLNQLLKDNYFSRPIPKSTGRDLFSLNWLQSMLPSKASPYDVAATLVELTAVTINNAIKKYASEVDEVYLCGGGSYNPTLVQRLKILLSPKKLLTTAALGVPPMQVEACAFSWLAMRRIHHLPGNVPTNTGAKGERVLGAIWAPFPINKKIN